jgi:tRNA threonylcarbamoyladenosine modification (KEOPS) complex  Pcc1 subunit
VVLAYYGVGRMKAEATIRLRFTSRRHMEIVRRALEPEAKRPTTARSVATLEKDGAFLVLKVEAEDTVALRAALNSYLRWISSTTSIIGFLETQKTA